MRKNRCQVPGVRYQVLLFSILVLLSFVLPGCGYTSRSMISNKYRKIYITPFINKVDFTQETAVADKYRVYRPMLEREVTRAVVDKYLFDGNLKPVEEDYADLILKGEVVDFRRDPVRYTENNDIEEYRINIIVNISLWDRKDDKMLWQENGFIGYESYFTEFAVNQQLRKTEDTTVNEAIKDLARRIVERTVEQW